MSLPIKYVKCTMDGTEQKILPITSTKAVYDENGKPLNEKMPITVTASEWEAMDHSKIKNGQIINVTDDYQGNICETVADCVASTNRSDVAGASAVKEVKESQDIEVGTCTSSNCTLTDVNCYKSGHVVILSVDMTVHTNVTQWGSVLTLPYSNSINRSTQCVMQANGADTRFYVANNTLCATSALNPSTIIRGQVIYLTND